MSLRIAVVSDLHCHYGGSGYSDSLLLSNLPRLPEKQHPVSALKLLIESQQIAADVLLMPGDISSRADMQGIISGWDYVHDIASTLSCGVIAPTLGNHDVIWKEPCDDSFILARQLSPLFPSQEELLSQRYWSDGFYVVEKEEYRILVINTVKHQTNEVSAKRGLISEGQLDSIERYLRGVEVKRYQICLCHHHPVQHEEIGLGPHDLMENGSLLVELLSRYKFVLLVHGHKHHPRLKVDSSGGNSLAIFASGSFSAGMNHGLGSRTRNVFHIVELRPDNQNSRSALGTIQTWQFQHQKGWKEASVVSVDFPFLTGFGCSMSPDDLANQIETNFRSSAKEIVTWNTIVQTSPIVDFVPPPVLKSVGDLLETKGLFLYPEAPDRPQHIAIKV